MNDNNQSTPIDFNKLAAYLDGALPSDEMATMESYVSSAIRLSTMMNEISELDNQIIDNCYSDEVISEMQSSEITLPEIDLGSANEVFFHFADSSDETLSSLFTDSLSPLTDNPIDFSDDGLGDMTDDNSFDDL